jgi:hypothetical protein
VAGCTTTRRTIFRTTITGRWGSEPAAVAGLGETVRAAKGAANASPPATHVSARTARLEYRRLGASVILVLAAAVVARVILAL